MLQAKLEVLIDSALRSLGIEKFINFKVDLPPRSEMGDFASNVAIPYAKKIRRSPLELAEEIKTKILAADHEGLLTKIEIANPGFINIFLSDQFIKNSIYKIIDSDHAWGKTDRHAGEKILLEFVSANPTGPLHVGHGRWAVIGDNITRLLKAIGYQVETECYVNNVGTQVETLEASVRALREGRVIPEGGYGGDYVREIKGESLAEMLDFLLAQQKSTLSTLGVHFDRFFMESDLHAQDHVRAAVQRLTERQMTYEENGAVWFKSRELGDDKNRVLIREDGRPTYFAADVAYHLNKFSRCYDHLIDIWGTDHHGYVQRLKAALKAAEQPVERLEIIIGQLVTLFRGNEPIRMSKRTGEMVTLQEVIDEIGVDATRFFFSATDVNSHLDFDLELAKKKSNDNPVYYLQYAHARICSILRKSGVGSLESGANLNSLTHPAERELMIKLLSLPDVVEASARLRHPHRITEYGKELAIVFHHFYEKCRVLGNPARLVLVDASRIVLRNVLELLGITAPESM